MEDDEPPKKRPPSVRQLSKTPSWVMLGFILGALCVLALPRPEPPARTVVVSSAPEEKRPPAEPPQITTVEAVFDRWSSFAVWDNDVTQIAVWDSAIGDFSDYYEVRRIDGNNYFRSIPHLTNRIVRHGKQPPPECPIRFTETEEQYRDWREHDRFERPPEEARPTLSVPRVSAPVPVPTTSVAPIAPPPVDNRIEVSPRK